MIADHLIQGLRNDIAVNGLGRIYTRADVAAWAIEPGDIDGAVDAGLVRVRYSGGNSRVPVRLDKPSRESRLHRVGPGLYSLDTEAAVQTGTRLWFEGRGYLVRDEVPDSPQLWRSIADRPGLAGLSWQGKSTACRDLMAHDPVQPTRTFHVVEAKGRTLVESDFYETFGQLFPIEDRAVVRGWTIGKVPKHGNALKLARMLAERWPDAAVTIAVLVPDFSPTGPENFYSGPSVYYPRQVKHFQHFVRHGDMEGDQPFPRLLRHLRDHFSLMELLGENAPIRFLLLGYQALEHVRNLATNQPVRLPASHTPE